MPAIPLSPVVRGGAVLLGLAAVLLLPGIAVDTVRAEGAALHRSTEVDGERARYREKRSDYRLEVDLVGVVHFAEDESDVVGLARGASLAIVEETGGVERSIEFRPDGDAVARRYRVDGDLQPFDAGARRWLARLLPEMFRQSGLQAAERSRRILGRGGIEALLAEIALVRTDHSRATYLEALFAVPELTEARFDAALALVEPLASDFERRRALQAAVRRATLPPAAQLRLLQLAGGIGSDFEAATLLVALVEQHPPRGAVIAAWQRVVAGIGSDFEQRRAIDALLVRGRPDRDGVLAALEVIGDIGSDFEQRTALQSALPLPADADVRAAWLRAAAGIGSDFEQRTALTALIGSTAVDVATADAVLAALGGIDSDFEAAQVLQALAVAMPGDPALIERYRAAARRLGEFERGQAERALDRFASVH